MVEEEELPGALGLQAVGGRGGRGAAEGVGELREGTPAGELLFLFFFLFLFLCFSSSSLLSV